jgi:signal transduction histidine kinase
MTSLTRGETFYFLRHSNGNIWLGEKGGYTIYYPGTKTFSFFSISDDVMVKCMTEDSSHCIWLATEKGLYKVDSNGKIIRRYTTNDGLPDEGIYSVITDRDGNIWFSHNKGISRINPDGSFFTMNKEDGLQENEFNTNCVFKTADGELFFGGVNGISSFYPDKIKMNNGEPKLFVTDIKVKEKDWHADTAFWNMPAIELPYNQNALAVSFNALGPENAEQYNYQYKMSGVDEQWINSGNNRTARYVLNPGEYRFQLYAGNGFNEQAKPLREIKVIIHPAWWQTWWFRTGVRILGIGILVFGIVSYNRRKLRKKLQEIKFQQQLQKERERISRDLHDNIGAYTSALIANADKLQATGNGTVLEADRVKENAKQILSSLRETIWVLNSKEISVTDFSDGFKQYANKMLENYPDVQIQFEEKIEDDKILSPAVALNLYRILQEALQNTLKYAKAKKIDFSICSNDKLGISLQDDGAGFNPAENGFGNGLNNMEHRAAEAGFDFSISSKPGNGAKVALSEK